MGQTKRAVWLNEYLQCWNATEAARRAKYKHPNTMGPRIKKELETEIAERVREKAMGADEVLAHLGDIARFDIGHVIGKGGVVNLEAAKEAHQTRHLKKVKWTPGAIELEAYDRLDALKTIAKHLGMFVERHEHSGPGGGPIQTQEHPPDFSKLDDDELDKYIRITRKLVERGA